jgi:membrane protein DedA with SNARE-associated domain
MTVDQNDAHIMVLIIFVFLSSFAGSFIGYEICKRLRQ